MAERRLRGSEQQHELINQAPTVCLELSPETIKMGREEQHKSTNPGFLPSSKSKTTPITHTTLEGNSTKTVREVSPVSLLPLLLTV